MVARETAAKDGQEGLWFPADRAGYMTLAKSAAQVATGRARFRAALS